MVVAGADLLGDRRRAQPRRGIGQEPRERHSINHRFCPARPRRVRRWLGRGALPGANALFLSRGLRRLPPARRTRTRAACCAVGSDRCHSTAGAWPVERRPRGLEHGDVGSKVGKAAVDRGNKLKDVGHPVRVRDINPRARLWHYDGPTSLARSDSFPRRPTDRPTRRPRPVVLGRAGGAGTASECVAR